MRHERNNYAFSAKRVRERRLAANRNAQRPTHRKWQWGPTQFLIAVLGVSIGGIVAINFDRLSPAEAATDDGSFSCVMPSVTDGDTIRCGSRRVRLAGIDAPEMPGHCRPGRECTPGDPFASKDNLSSLIGWSSVQCRQTDTDHYGRTVARCEVKGADLSCRQVEGGFAVRRYGDISC